MLNFFCLFFKFFLAISRDLVANKKQNLLLLSLFCEIFFKSIIDVSTKKKTRSPHALQKFFFSFLFFIINFTHFYSDFITRRCLRVSVTFRCCIIEIANISWSLKRFSFCLTLFLRRDESRVRKDEEDNML